MSDRLNIQNEMRQLDLKSRSFYDELTDEERKKFSTYLMIRWGSAVRGSRELQEYYVISTNERLNTHFFTASRHPKLQWLMATAVSPDMGAQRHDWIAPKKKATGDSARRKKLREIFPHYRDDEIDVMMSITTDAELREYQRQTGEDTK
jgi:hypothetical protein